jgi:hypothetical protein
VGDSTIAGTPASVDQFNFHSNYQYRHVAFSTTFGTLKLYEIGKYQGHTTTIVGIDGGVQAIAVLNANTIAYVSKNPAGVPFLLYFGATNQGCL